MSDPRPVIFEERPAGDARLGLITLNIEKTLNSLTLEMVELMRERLAEWRKDPAIACVVIRGAGEKALCAGGDVQALYRSAVENPGGPCEYAETFFEHEYRLDYQLHRYPKPVICWGHGIVMGGGLGIMAGCSHRVVTEKTRIAMPEVTIALHPDVGGGWFLNRMPGHSGLFLALTAANINAADALYVRLGDHFITSDQWQPLLERLTAQPWHKDEDHNQQLVDTLLGELEQSSRDQLPEANVEPHQARIDELCNGDDAVATIETLCALQDDDKWLQKARDTLRAGSALAALYIHRQLREVAGLSLEDVFRSELQLSTNIVRYPEFAEGVRALLIDKDRNPAWQYPSARDVPREVVDRFFQPPWASNPLADLGTDNL